MVALRIVQGFCLGGELPGALTYVVETAPRIAPFVCGVVFACVTMGVAAATGVSLSVRSLLPPAIVAGSRLENRLHPRWPRRDLSFVLRRSLEESPEFARMRGLASRQPFRDLLRTHATPVLVGCALLAGTACFNGLFFSHLPAYLSACPPLRRAPAVFSQTVGVVASSLGDSRDRLAGRSHPASLSAPNRRDAPAMLAYPFYSALDARALNLTLLLTLAGLVAGLTNGSFACLLTDLFPTRIRFTGVALSSISASRFSAARRRWWRRP